MQARGALNPLDRGGDDGWGSRDRSATDTTGKEGSGFYNYTAANWKSCILIPMYIVSTSTYVGRNASPWASCVVLVLGRGLPANLPICQPASLSMMPSSSSTQNGRPGRMLWLVALETGGSVSGLPRRVHSLPWLLAAGLLVAKTFFSLSLSPLGCQSPRPRSPVTLNVSGMEVPRYLAYVSRVGLLGQSRNGRRLWPHSLQLSSVLLQSVARAVSIATCTAIHCFPVLALLVGGTRLFMFS